MSHMPPRTPSPAGKHAASAKSPAQGVRVRAGTPVGGSNVGIDARDARLAAEDQNAGAFQNYTDYVKHSHGRHDSDRKDNFSTPSRLHEHFTVPTRLDRRFGLGDTHDLREICEQGFEKTMRHLSGEVLADVRAEVRLSMEGFQQEVMDTVGALVENRDDGVSRKLELIYDKVQQLQEDTSHHAKTADFSEFDFKPFRDLVHGCEKTLAQAHHDMTDRLENLIKRTSQKVLDEIEVVRQLQEQTDNVTIWQIREDIHKIQVGTDLEEFCKGSEAKLSQLFDKQNSLVADFGKSFQQVEDMLCQNTRHFADLAPSLETQLSKCLKEVGLSVDFSPVSVLLAKSNQAITADFAQLLAELGRIQQKLNVDYVQDAEIEMDLTEIATASPVHGPPGAIEDAATGEGGFSVEMGAAPPKKVPKRLRDYYCQTDVVDIKNMWTQTDGTLEKKAEGKGKIAKLGKAVGKVKAKPVFADADAMKNQMRRQLVRPQFNVAELYLETGMAQHIARSWWFEQLTFFFIILNAIWIAVDADNNEAEMLIDAHPVFQVAENIFCLYFLFEVVVRFFAFKLKMSVLKDHWFLFDTALVGLMIVETWVFPLILVTAGTKNSGTTTMSDASIFRMARMVKISRIARMARILRAIPELVILLKGIGAASRSVLSFMLLWVIIVYIFAVMFRQLTDGQEVGRMYFGTVPIAMNTLVLDGILPNNAFLVNSLSGAHPGYFPIIMVFILLASVTLMYMLIGVLVEVVGAVATTEKEGMTVRHVASQLREVLNRSQYGCDAYFSKMQFQNLLLEPEVMKILQSVNVDVVVLMEMSDLIYEDCDKEGKGIGFESFVDAVLNQRGTNPATVKSVNESLRVIDAMFKNTTTAIVTVMNAEFAVMRSEVRDLREARVREVDMETDSSDDGRELVDRTSAVCIGGMRATRQWTQVVSGELVDPDDGKSVDS